MNDQDKNKLKMCFLRHFLRHRKENPKEGQHTGERKINIHICHKDVNVHIRKDTKKSMYTCTYGDNTFYSWDITDVVDFISTIDHERVHVKTNEECFSQYENMLKNFKWSYELRNNSLCVFRKESEFIIQSYNNENKIWSGIIRKYNFKGNFKKPTGISGNCLRLWYQIGRVPKCTNSVCRLHKLYTTCQFNKQTNSYVHKCFEKNNISCGGNSHGTVIDHPVYRPI